MHIIHEEYVRSVRENNCFRRHEISREKYDVMTSESDRRFWSAREYRTYTKIGYVPYRWTRRRWGDGVKIIDIWRFVEEMPADFVEIEGDELKI